MASPIMPGSEQTQIVRNLQATATDIQYTMRGEWQPDTEYKRFDYVYSPKHPGFLYVATNSGTSQSATQGKTTLEEPVWDILGSFVYDGVLQFVAEEVSEDVANRARAWKPNTLVRKDDLITPSHGPVIVHGEIDQYFVFRLNKCVTNLDWPRTPREYLQDNDIQWECRVSYGKLLPAARLKEPMYVELVEIMDFLRLHEEMYFDDLTYKFADQMRVRNTSVKEVISEFGYNYITDFVGLTDKELQSAMEYLSLIHYLKGSEAGLSLVFEILGVSARWEEWWESTPQGLPDTWRLWIDMDISKASSSLTTKVINFTRQYVYPIMKEYEVTYAVNLIQINIAIGGFIEAEYKFDISPGMLVMQGVGAFIDKEYNFSLSAIVYPVVGKQDYLGQVFGFKSIFGDIGSWGSNWSRYLYDSHNREAVAGDDGYPKGDGYQVTDVTEDEALVLISASKEYT